jgi:hypothetical protein
LRQVFNSTLLNGTATVATGSAVLSAPFPFTATSGFCGAQCGNEYVIYLVAEDEQVPPNRVTTVRREPFSFGCGDSTELVIYDNATETCTQTFLAGRARPSLALTPASVGFPAGPAVPMRGYLERSFRVSARTVVFHVLDLRCIVQAHDIVCYYSQMHCFDRLSIALTIFLEFDLVCWHLFYISCLTCFVYTPTYVAVNNDE